MCLSFTKVFSKLLKNIGNIQTRRWGVLVKGRVSENRYLLKVSGVEGERAFHKFSKASSS